MSDPITLLDYYDRKYKKKLKEKEPNYEDPTDPLNKAEKGNSHIPQTISLSSK